jgi:serine phosphatase RsbU (regulator of sigma subunit)
LGGLVGLYITITRERRASTLAKTQAVAEAAQLAILSPVPTQIGPYHFAALYRSASEEALVGGDFYSVVTTQFGVRILVGDVQGKGIEAVQLSAAVMGCFREWASELAKLSSLVAKLEDRIVASAPNNEFVTAIVATLEGDLTMEHANCGHPSPVLFAAGRQLSLDPERRSVPLGLGADPTIERRALHPDDRVLFYTDALTESRDRKGRFIPFEELSRNLAAEPFDAALDDLLSGLEARAGRLRDDSATLLVEVASRSRDGDDSMVSDHRGVPQPAAVGEGPTQGLKA